MVKLKTAIYIRVSTEEQAEEGYSIQAQRNRLEAYCISQEWDIIGFYVDEGISGKNMERPELQRMIKHIQEGFIDIVLVYKLDRLTRSVLDLYKLLDTFDKNNCKFKSATEIYDTTTAAGRMFITLVATFAQFERESIAERVRMGMSEKAQQGKWVSNTAPMGYEIDRENDTLVINESEALIVKEIYDLYLSGMGMRNIAVTLNKERKLSKSGSEWSSASVGYILKNPTYTGSLRWNYRVNKDNYFEIEDSVPIIIEKEEFEKVQATLKNRKKFHPRTATSQFIFSGVLKCARCGASMFGKSSQSKRGDKVYHMKTYQCVNNSHGRCDMPRISQNYIEDRFLNKISKWKVKEQVVINELNEKPHDNHEKEIKQIEKELSQIDKRKTKWQYAWANEKISDEDFSNRMNEENESEKRLKEHLKTIQPTQEEYSSESNIELLSDVLKNWTYLEDTEKKTSVQMLIKKIVVERVSQQRKPECINLEIEYH